MKKNYFLFVLISVTIIFPFTVFAESLSQKLAGKIILQVEKNGEAWYVNPDNLKRYFLGRPSDALALMRELGLGIKHDELESYLHSQFPKKLAGKILLDVQQNGEAYYIFPLDLKGYYLSHPADALNVMKKLGLGISNNNINKIIDYNAVTYSVDCIEEYSCNLNITKQVTKHTEIFIPDILNKLRAIKSIGPDSVRVLTVINNDKIILEHASGDACWSNAVLYEVSAKNKNIAELGQMSHYYTTCGSDDKQKIIEEENKIKKYQELKNNLLK